MNAQELITVEELRRLVKVYDKAGVPVAACEALREAADALEDCQDHRQHIREELEQQLAEREQEILRLDAAISDLGEECHKLRERAEKAEKRLQGAREGYVIADEEGDFSLSQIRMTENSAWMKAAADDGCSQTTLQAAGYRAVPVLIIPKEPK